MGATTFGCKAIGKTAKEAFNRAVEDAQYEYGHGGYTGSIAEKSSFVMIDMPKGENFRNYAYELIDQCDPRIDDKWGPAGCIDLGGGEFYFFGWASE